MHRAEKAWNVPMLVFAWNAYRCQLKGKFVLIVFTPGGHTITSITCTCIVRMDPLPGAGSPHCILLPLIAIAFGAPSPVFLVCELASYVGGYGGRHCH